MRLVAVELHNAVSGIARAYGKIMFKLRVCWHSIFTVVIPFVIPIDRTWFFQSLHILANIMLVLSASNKYLACFSWDYLSY